MKHCTSSPSLDKILLIDDEPDVLYSFQRIFDGPTIKILTATSGEAGLAKLTEDPPQLVIMDVRMAGLSGLETLRKIREMDSRIPVIIMTAYGTTQTAIEAMKLGAHDYILKPFDVPALKLIVDGALKASRAMGETAQFKSLLASEDIEQGIIGRSALMQEVFKTIGQVASSQATVLITGESGTGKELVAKALHKYGSRQPLPYMAINCAAIPEALLESELFGHEKGAFTGAHSQRIGKFEQCHRGTLFLDEIGDMPLSTQAKILRIIQSGTFERVGGNAVVKVDVRLIAATNKELEKAVASKEFREDLFYRLNVVRIKMPALRDRKGDLHLLINFFIQKFARETSQSPKSISKEALQLLESYHWPGNVRELENAIHRTILMAQGDAILPIHLPPEIQGYGGAKTLESPKTLSSEIISIDPAKQLPPTFNLAEQASALFHAALAHKELKLLPAVEKELVLCAMEYTQGNQVKASKLLGITRATLRKRIQKFNITQKFDFSNSP